MDNPLRDHTEAQEPRHEESCGFVEDSETSGGTSMPIKDADATLSMIVLLLACLALAGLAHVIVL